MSKLPGGAVSARPLYIIFVADVSASMSEHGKIAALNIAVRECLPALLKIAAENPFAQVLVRVIAFGNTAYWVTSTPTPLAAFKWTDLSADGQTAMGDALLQIAAELDPSKMPARGLSPVLVLISDGQPSDLAEFERGLKAL